VHFFVTKLQDIGALICNFVCGVNVQRVCKKNAVIFLNVQVKVQRVCKKNAVIFFECAGEGATSV